MVATIKVIPFAVPEPVLAAAEDAARRLRPAFAVHPFRARRWGLVVSTLPGLKDSVIEGTVAAMTGRVESIGGTLLPPVLVAHRTAAIAEALGRLLADGAEALLIAGASATVDRRDVGPAAVVAAGGAVVHFGMPVDPGNLICLARIGAVPALVLPGCARSPKANGIDWVMQRLAAGIAVEGPDVMAMGVGGLLKESDARPLPRARRRAPAAARPVAAIVLAAGRSSRSGPTHKLLARDPTGTPMLARTVDEVLASAARPVVVVLGHREAEMRAVIGSRDVTIVVAGDHAQGLSASLRAGLAALPASARAALVCLGDMPLVTGAVLDRLIATWDQDEGRLVVQPTFGGRPGNPVLFDRALFPRLRDLQGDVGARALLATLTDELVAVEVGTDAVLRDFDTPDSLRDWSRPRDVAPTLRPSAVPA
jgi:molybdenum cofactor cytidylyltransferase